MTVEEFKYRIAAINDTDNTDNTELDEMTIKVFEKGSFYDEATNTELSEREVEEWRRWIRDTRPIR